MTRNKNWLPLRIGQEIGIEETVDDITEVVTIVKIDHDIVIVKDSTGKEYPMNREDIKENK